jgi:hypothetical protein
MRNNGKTFAKDLIVINVVEPLLQGQKPDFKKELSRNTPVSISVLAPNVDYIVTAHIAITPPTPVVTEKNLADLKEEIATGKLRIIVHGIIKYKDVFGCQHWTTYCFEMSPRWEFMSCNTNNDADENTCPQ